MLLFQYLYSHIPLTTKFFLQMKQKTTGLILFLFFSIGLWAQNAPNNISKQLDKQKVLGIEMVQTDLFKQELSRTRTSLNVDDEVAEAVFFSMNDENYEALKSNPQELLKIELPILNQKNIILELYKTSIVTEDFNVYASSDRNNPYPFELGSYYWGIVQGDQESVVSISISSNGLSGFIFSNGNTYNLGKLENQEDIYVLYEEKDLLIQNTLGCDVDDSKHIISNKMESSERAEDPNNCVKMYIEVDKDIYDDKGSVQATADYITDAFAQVAILYANESINFAVNEILVWDTTDPYTGPNTSNYLDQFRNHLGGVYNGDLAHLVGYQGGGGIAYVDVLCNGTYGVGYSDINSSFSIVPTYSWTIEVLTHEIGHNLGSRHTHNCVWNGNNTAIDRCGPAAGYDAQPCNQDAPIPDKGTIMSYCHLVSGVGIDFNLGFGPQPGDLIRNRVYNASCLTACSQPTVNDAGISSINNPSGVLCDANTNPQVELTNYGTDPLTSVDIEYSVDGGSVSTFQWSGNLASGTSTLVNLSSISFSIGTHTFDASTTLPNGVADEDNANDSNSSSFTRQSEQTFYADSDGDGFGDPNVSVLDCFPPQGFVSDNTDCNDNNGSEYPGASCNDGDVCTTGDVLDANCNCAGVFTDSDGDGVCDANDLCAGGDDNIDVNNNGIPDFCECFEATTTFDINPLVHSGGGNSSTTKSFAANDKNASFTISDLGSKTNGSPNSRYIDVVTINYVDGNGSNQNYGSFSGENQSSINVSLTGVIQSITVELSNGLNTNKSLSVNLSAIDYCSGTPPCADADSDGVCDGEDVCPGFDDNLIGTACSDGDDCTINDVWGNDCNCNGTYSDSDGDGVCDGEDVCPGGDDTIDTDGDGIPDACDSDCTSTSTAFTTNPLTHSGGGSSATSITFPAGNLDATFTISDLNAKENGNPNSRFIDRVTVTYVDGNGSTIQEGVYNGNSQSSANINITGPVQSVTVTLEDGYDGNSGSTVLSVSMSDVTSCIPVGNISSVNKEISNVSVFPNPAMDNLTIQFDGRVENASVQLMDMLGRVIFSREIQKENSLDIALNDMNLSNNLVYVIVRIEQENPILKKIVILR